MKLSLEKRLRGDQQAEEFVNTAAGLSSLYAKKAPLTPLEITRKALLATKLIALHRDSSSIPFAAQANDSVKAGAPAALIAKTALKALIRKKMCEPSASFHSWQRDH